MVEGFRREDPPSVPQLAVPVTVPHYCQALALTTSCEQERATGLLANIGFYFLLRVGEYTKPRFVIRNRKKVRATRTIQFSVENIGFFKDGKVIPKSSPLHVLLSCDAATLKISNQKMDEWEIQSIKNLLIKIPAQ